MSEKSALILPVALGALGWLLTHYVERVTDSPTVEYHIKKTGCEVPAQGVRTCDYRYTITNLSRTTAFGPIRFDFEGRGITGFRVEPVSPAHEGDQPPQGDHTTVTFNLPSLMPGGAVIFVVRAVEQPAMFVRPTAPIRMSHVNLETLLARYEMTIMSILVILAGGVIFWILRGSWTKKEKEPVIQRHQVLLMDPADNEKA